MPTCFKIFFNLSVFLSLKIVKYSIKSCLLNFPFFQVTPFWGRIWQERKVTQAVFLIAVTSLKLLCRNNRSSAAVWDRDEVALTCMRKYCCIQTLGFKVFLLYLLNTEKILQEIWGKVWVFFRLFLFVFLLLCTKGMSAAPNAPGILARKPHAYYLSVKSESSTEASVQ